MKILCSVAKKFCRRTYYSKFECCCCWYKLIIFYNSLYWNFLNKKLRLPVNDHHKLGDKKGLQKFQATGPKRKIHFLKLWPNPGLFIICLKTGTLPHCTTDDWANIASLTWSRWAIKTGWIEYLYTELEREKSSPALGFDPLIFWPKSSSLSWFPILAVVSAIFCLLQPQLAPNW